MDPVPRFPWTGLTIEELSRMEQEPQRAQARRGAIAAWLQREDDELLYAADDVKSEAQGQSRFLEELEEARRTVVARLDEEAQQQVAQLRRLWESL